MKLRIKRAWMKTFVKMSDAKSRWQCVEGPIAAAIATLMDSDWQPVDPTAWITPESVGHSVSNNASSKQLACFTETQGHAAKQVLHRLEGDLEAAVWDNASSAHNGQGLEFGLPNFEPASRAHAKFVKEGDYKKAKAVELVVNTKVWTKQRLLGAGIITTDEAMCDRCGLHVETDRHRYYACSANDHIHHEDVTNTDYIAKDARRRPHLACMWYRAIMPGNIATIPVGWAPLRTTTTTTSTSRNGSTQRARQAPTALAELTQTPELDGRTRGQRS